MSWQRISAATGGTVAALAARTDHVFAATPVGVFASADSGRTWGLLGGTRTVPFGEALAQADDGTIIVGARTGLYRSAEGGSTWRQVLTDAAILGVCTAPGGIILVTTEDDGVLRSDDDGRSWTGANAGLLDLTVLAAALSPDFASDHTGFVGTASGLYRTRNGARSWRAVEVDLDEVAVQCLAVSPGFAADRLVLAGTETAGLLLSPDAGSTWHVALPHNTTALAFSKDGEIVAATEAGIAVSTDKGASWRLHDTAPGAVLSLAFSMGVLLAGLARDGVARSDDLGATWQGSNAGLTAYVPTAFTVTANGGHVLATLEGGLPGVADAVVYGLAASDVVYAATTDGLFESRDGGASWRQHSAGAAMAVAAGPAGPIWAGVGGTLSIGHVVVRTFDGDVLALAQPDAQTVLVGIRTGGEFVLWRSDNLGETWQRWLVERAAGPAALAVSHGNVFVGIGNCVQAPISNTRERRGGETRPLWRRVELRGASAVTAMAALDQLVAAGTNIGVFLSRDVGQTFERWSEGLDPPGIVGVAIGPDRSVYAVTPGGSVWRQLAD